MKFIHRMISIASAAVLSVGAIAMFSACTSSEPKVTITYLLDNTEYEVEYTLSRSDAPKTVQHFIELADAGYYDGTCIHDYDGSALYGGGYVYNGENANDPEEILDEKDYFAVVRQLEQEGHTFTQSVYYGEGASKVPLYTVYGEFKDNGVSNEGGRKNVHSKGALVMYYTDKTTSAKNIDVTVVRNDGGDNNEGAAEQKLGYAMNSATSLFYTYLNTSNTSLDSKYAVFGKADLDQLQALLDAIEDLTPEDNTDTPDVDESDITEDVRMRLDRYDHESSVDVFANIADAFETVRKGGEYATFNFLKDHPIVIKTVKVTKY